MSRRDAERFERALQQPAKAEMTDLVETARRLEALAEPPPSPPHRLAPGRQRLLAEAARHRSAQTKRRKERRKMTGVMRLGTALLALVLVVGLTFGASQAAADSLPGEPPYGLKLAVEEARLSLTSDPDALAALNLALAEERLDEVTALLEQGQAVDEVVATRVEQQLRAALAAPGQALEGLAVAIQQRQRTMEQLAGETPGEPLRQLIREMERVRQEAHAGQGEPQGGQQRQRQGTPADPAALPDPSHTPGPAGPKATDQPGPGPVGPQPTDQPGTGPGPDPSHTPEPVGPQPTDQPGPGPMEPQPTHSPSPGGPQSTGQPGHGSGEGGQGRP
jgi:hypothetical protein